MAKLIMGYWDCPYCEQTGIEGTLRECPSCGHPREKNTQFYMKNDEKRYLTKEEEKTKGKGADWICGACDTLNSALDNCCKSCGSPRDTKDGDYFSREKMKSNSSIPKKTTQEMETGKKSNKRFSFAVISAICIMLGIVAFVLYSFCTPKIENFHVNHVFWETTQEVETLNTYHESGWDIPDGGRQTDKKREIKTYKKVLDHYETVQKTRTKQVLDHYETKYKHSDNGDGTFSEESYQEPVYRTETEHYTEEEPVYRDEPIYAWKYYYDIDRWEVSDKLIETGEKDVTTVTYAKVNSNKTTRKGDKHIRYFCDVTYNDGKKKGKSEKYELSEELYKKIQTDTDVSMKIEWGDIVEILD